MAPVYTQGTLKLWSRSRSTGRRSRTTSASSELDQCTARRFHRILHGYLGGGRDFRRRSCPSGHYYFTLKDEAAQMRCVCFKTAARYLKFKPQDGVAVLARGRVDVYDARGDHQLLVEAIEPQGHGALQLAFEQLKKKLAAEGLFASARKRALPALAGAHRHRDFAHRRGDSGHAAASWSGASQDGTSACIRRRCRARARRSRSPRDRLFQRVRMGRGGDRGARRRVARRSVDVQ